MADEILRDDFQRKDYQDVILPFTVLRRIDCVLESTKDQVRDRYKRLKDQGLENLDGALRRVSEHFYYNIYTDF